MNPKKLNFIDALRGIAAAYVALYHLGHMTGEVKIVPDWLNPVTNAGGTGVMLFFVLSAFTLCLSMDQRRLDEERPLVNYYLRRFFRIAPLFYVFLVISIARDAIAFNAWHSPGEIARSVFFVFNLKHGSEQGIVWASWTIGVEMLFYVAFPLFYKIADNLGKSIALLLIAISLRMIWHNFVSIAIPDPASSNSFYQMSFLHHVPTFLVGVVSYHVYKMMNIDSARKIGVGYALIVLSITSYVGMIYGGISFMAFGDQTTVQAVMFASLLIGLSVSDSKIIVNRASIFLGKVSYSFYLSHSTILFLLSPLIMWVGARTGNTFISYFIIALSCIVIIASFSFVTYKLVEQPGNNIGRKIIRRVSEKRGPEASLNQKDFPERTN